MRIGNSHLAYLLFGLFSVVDARGHTALADLYTVVNNKVPTPKYQVRELDVCANPQFECLDSYFSVGNSCERLIFEKAVKSCPGGWKYVNEEQICIGHDVTEPDVVCPVGKQDGNNCSIVVEKPVIITCPNNFTFDEQTGNCRYFKEIDPIEYCDNGQFIYDGKCVELSDIEVRAVCPADSVLRDGRCQHEQRVEPSFVCPPSFEVFKDQCIKREVIPAVLTCESGMLTGEICRTQDTVPVIETCPQSFVYSPGVGCTREHSMAPQLLCPESFSFNALTNMCQYDSYTDAVVKEVDTIDVFVSDASPLAALDSRRMEYICPPDFVLQPNKTCYAQLLKVPVVQCPENYRLNSNNNCVRLEIATPALSCPPEYFLNGCQCEKNVDFTPERNCPVDFVLEGDSCVKTVQIEGERHCRNDYAFVASGFCVRKVIFDPLLECPPNYLLLERSGTHACSKVVSKIPKYRCGINQIPRDDKCVLALSAEANFGCEPGQGYDSARKTCYTVEKVPLTLACPKNFTLSNNKCYKKLDIRPISSCPEGFELDSGLDQCYYKETLPATAVCPVGFLYNSETQKCCVKEKRYEFDAEKKKTPRAPIYEPGSNRTRDPPQESLKDLVVKPKDIKFDQGEPGEMRVPAKKKPCPEEPLIEEQLRRPLVHTGVVLEDQIIILRGKKSAVEENMKLLQNGADISSLKNVEVEVHVEPEGAQNMALPNNALPLSRTPGTMIPQATYNGAASLPIGLPQRVANS